MLQVTRTDSTNPDFIALVKQLDADLAVRDGEEHAFYDQFNKIDAIQHVVVGYENNQPVACGAVKMYTPATMEVKRMYTVATHRGKGHASEILHELEHWAGELKVNRLILETGVKQPEAISLYKKKGYVAIPNYGQYSGVANSLCFEKLL